jgi:hypothetical protein
MPFANASSSAAGNAGTDLIPVADLGGKLRVANAVFNCATDVVGSYTAPIRLPRGARVLFLVLNASATMGASATLAIGIAGTTGKYRAAATFTAANTPTLVGLNATVAEPLTAEEQILLTVAVASLPASGRLVISFVYVDNS